jgi:DNA-binding SARP family transcriptional activator/tetratricopeptide (TPR) repeat protein
MRFGLLGPLLVFGDEGGQSAPSQLGPRLRVLLAALLLRANEPVSVDALAEVVWDGAPPPGSAVTLRSHVMRLRNALGPDAQTRLVSRDPGYLIHVDESELDVLRFEALCHEAGAALRRNTWTEAATVAAAALDLWRGTPLVDIPSQTLTEIWRPRLENLRLQACDGRIEAELNLGNHERLIPELQERVAEYPLREKPHAQLMLALARCGRQAEALTVYRDVRTVLVGELGVEPGPELRELHAAILAGDAGSLAPRPEPPPRTDPRPAPRQLPAAAGHFTGRSAELELLSALSSQTGAGGGTVTISAIDGMAGIGKTALAVHAAHRFAERFPDGQLFIDLHGYTRGYRPRSAGEALDWFLRALGVPPQQIPQDLEERAAVYRNRLSDTRTLILLDNASSEAQVRPLLPAAPGCLVLVTSRRRLKGLDDARVVSLDVLPAEDAVELLRVMVGDRRMAPDDPAVQELAALCGRLPLALRIAAALLRHRPAWTVDHLVRLLRDQSHRVTALTDGEHELATVFDLSYQGLTEPQQRLFRLLGLVPGPDIDAYAAAALIDSDLRSAERLLEDLVDHNLLIDDEPGRYRPHDLVRLYARAMTEKESADERDAAIDRLLDYYSDTARAADRFLARRTPGSAVVVRYPPRDRPDPATLEEASAWMRAELPNLIAAVDLSAGRADALHAVALPVTMHGYLRSHGPWPQALRLHTSAAEVARRQSDPLGEATALTDLATVRWLGDDYDGAIEAAGRALDLARASGNELCEANALTELGTVRWLLDDYKQAVDALGQAIDLYERIGDQRGNARALAEVGTVRRLTGDYAGSIQALERSLQLTTEVGDRQGQAIALFGLGSVRHITGDYAGVVEAQERALELFRELGSLLGQRGALSGLGHVRRVIGDYTGSVEAHSLALEISQELGDRQGQAIGLLGLGKVQQLAGDHREAIRTLQQALELFQELESKQGEANAINDLGSVWLVTGDYKDAVRAHQQALELFRQVGDPQGEAEALNRWGSVLLATGDPDQARSRYTEALRLAREIASPVDEADALEGLGECLVQEGRPESGAAQLSQALAICRRLGVPAAERLAARLSELGLEEG